MAWKGYANPLRAVQGLTAERIDQGVDYSGSGDIYALGPGTIENVYNAGWPGGAFISERLSGGPYAGLYSYAAENISPAVAVGQPVDDATVIGRVTGGIETGWAAPPRPPPSPAHPARQVTRAHPTPHRAPLPHPPQPPRRPARHPPP